MNKQELLVELKRKMPKATEEEMIVKALRFYNRLYWLTNIQEVEGRYLVCLEADLKTVRVIGIINEVTFIDLHDGQHRGDVTMLANKRGHDIEWEDAILPIDDDMEKIFSSKEEILEAYPEDELVLKWATDDDCKDVEW